MKNECPGFDLLSQFSDGALDEPVERKVAAHAAGCPACTKVLRDIEGVDALVAFSLPSARPKFRLLRPAMIPVAAAVIFGVAIGLLLSMSPGGADTPIAVAEASPASVAPPPEPVRNVFYQDQFAAPTLSPLWKTSEAISTATPLVDGQGRRALSLPAQAGGKKRWALVSTSSDFPVGDGLAFDVDYRISRPQKGGRMQVLLQSSHGKTGRQVLRWSRTADEELLEAQSDRSKPAVLWSAKSAADSEWHKVKVVLTPNDVILSHDGVETARRPHGLTLDRAGLSLGSTMDKRPREPHESTFECQVGGVVVTKQPAQ